MPTEIEAKLKLARRPGGVGSPAKIARKLKAAGGKFLCQQLQTDAYFDDGKATMRKADSALRIRCWFVGRRQRAVITFKGPKQKGRFKRREEVQFEVDNAASAEALLAAIGYKKTLAFQKKRRIWRLDDCEVAIDELPLLGDFVEIEGPYERKIAAVQKKLGLEDFPHIPDSYASLMERKLRKLGRKRREIFL